MTKLFKPFSSLLRLYRNLGKLSLAYRLLPETFTPAIAAKVKTKGDIVSFPEYEKRFSKKQITMFGQHGELLLKFIKAKNISFESDKSSEEKIVVQCNDKTIRLHALGYDNLKVAEEIFIDRLYEFSSPSEYVVCDVGMNVGAAALFFASYDNVKKVYGYEPFPGTFELAQKNISLNPQLKHKIEPFDFGVGKTDQELQVPAGEQGFLGGTTTDFMIEQLPGSQNRELTEVKIRGICGVIKQVKNLHAGVKLILKLDCEGAEYDIVGRLAEADMLHEIDVFMIEYHFLGKRLLLDALQPAGFHILSPGSEDINPFGMLYAISSKR